MNKTLEDLIGKRVTVWSLGAQMEDTDIGILEDFEHPFIRLRKDEDILVFPVYRVRLIKPVRP